MTPNKPAHADREYPVPGAEGFTIKRVLEGYAYPQNGNAGNPTPRYQYLLKLDGKLVDRDSHERVLRDSARQPNAREDYSR